MKMIESDQLSTSESSPTFKLLPYSEVTCNLPSLISYNCNYQAMSPSSQEHCKYYGSSSQFKDAEREDIEIDTQYSSLFGDPVPPSLPFDLFETQLSQSHLQRLKTSAQTVLGSYEDTSFGKNISFYKNDKSEVYPSMLSYSFSGVNCQNENNSPLEVFQSSLPMLDAPYIQILTNSSSGSCFEEIKQTPNKLSTTNNMWNNINNAKMDDSKDLINKFNNKIENTNTGDDSLLCMDSFCKSSRNNSIEQDETFEHEYLNETTRGPIWFHEPLQNSADRRKIPRMRPSSRNIMSIKCGEMPLSPVSAIINETNSSSSGENYSTKNVAIDASLNFDKFEKNALTETSDISFKTLLQEHSSGPILPQSILKQNEYTHDNINRETSPVILKDSISIGSNNRVDEPRLHKKSSFTIISKNSQIPLIFHTKDYNQQNEKLNDNFQANFKLPQLSQNFAFNRSNTDHSPRHSVQFDIAEQIGTNELQAYKMQHRKNFFETQVRKSSLISDDLKVKQKFLSTENLPLVAKQDHKITPKFQHLANARLESESTQPQELLHPIKLNSNPTRKQKGLLQVINGNNILTRKFIQSKSISTEDLTTVKTKRHSLGNISLKIRRRSSSTSPERKSSTISASDRRSSNLSSITTSDGSNFKFAFLSKSHQHFKPKTSEIQNQTFSRDYLRDTKNLKYRNKSKVAKPTTLSPIIGTPNKDSSIYLTSKQNTSRITENLDSDMDYLQRRNSLSKIPVRTDSEVNTKRASSKELDLLLSSSDPMSHITPKRLPLRALMQDETKSIRNISRAPSRSSSRTSTRQIAISRPNSLNDVKIKKYSLKTSSRSSSLTKSLRSTSVSPSNLRARETPLKRNKSVPLNETMLKNVASPKSTSDTLIKPASKHISVKSVAHRKSSRSRIPTRLEIRQTVSASPQKSKITLSVSKPKKVTSMKNLKTFQKESQSAKKVPVLVRKVDSSVKIDQTSKKPQLSLKKNIEKSAIAVQNKTESNSQKLSKIKNKRIEMSKKTIKKTKDAINRISTQKEHSTTDNTTQITTKKKVESEKTLNVNKPEKLVENIIDKVDFNEKNQSPIIEETSDSITTKVEVSAKHSPSNISLVRMSSKLSLLSKTRPNSSLSKKLTSDNVAKDSEINKVDKIETRKNPDSHISQEKNSIKNTGSDVELVNANDTNISPIQNFEKQHMTSNIANDDTHKMSNENLSNSKIADQYTKSMPETEKFNLTMIVEGHDEFETTKPLQSETENNGLTKNNHLGNITPVHKSPAELVHPVEASVSILSSGGAYVGVESTERVSARAISVLPEVECESENFQNFEYGISNQSEGEMIKDVTNIEENEEVKEVSKRRSPDGQGGSTTGSIEKTGSQEYLEEKENDEGNKCCFCCTKLCMPCRRSRCSRCFKRNKKSTNDELKEPVLSASSSATTTNLDGVEHTSDKHTSCWQKLNCCKMCIKKNNKSLKDSSKIAPSAVAENTPSKSSKSNSCGLCLKKVFCCRSTNKIDPKTGNELNLNKCCFCIPFWPKRNRQPVDETPSVGWQDVEQGLPSVVKSDKTNSGNCCSGFFQKLPCCRKKSVSDGSRRQSMKPTPTSEDMRRKLHVDLVEYNSKMKAAIPVLPLYLAWFCAICNTLLPGLGTLLSGFFCICVGIPRFSQYDSAKARIGSLIINIIVAVAQLFCVLFCFVGWGWSIWWGTIMLKCARKLSKIRKVEKLELEEEKRQAATVARAAHAVDTDTTKPL